MPIIVRLDRQLVERRMSLSAIRHITGHSTSRLSRFKNGRVQSVGFDLLEGLCIALCCKPGDLLEYSRETVEDQAPLESAPTQPPDRQEDPAECTQSRVPVDSDPACDAELTTDWLSLLTEDERRQLEDI